MRATTDGRLSDVEVKWSKKHACCVIAASKGYPEHYEKGFELTLPADREGVYVAGAVKKDGRLLTSGGRVVGVTRVADTLEEAIGAAYRALENVGFGNKYYRTDIGKRALQAREK